LACTAPVKCLLRKAFLRLTGLEPSLYEGRGASLSLIVEHFRLFIDDERVELVSFGGRTSDQRSDQTSGSQCVSPAIPATALTFLKGAPLI
jgi:hypothetical protein